MNCIKKILYQSDLILGSTLRWICILSLIGIFVLYIINVFVRFLPITNLKVTDEIVEMLMGWVVFFGAAALQRERKHFALDFIIQKIEGHVSGKLINILVYLLSMLFIGVLFYYGFDLFNRSNGLSAILRIPRGIFYVCVPISALIMGIYMTRDVVKVFASFRKPKEA